MNSFYSPKQALKIQKSPLNSEFLLCFKKLDGSAPEQPR